MEKTVDVALTAIEEPARKYIKGYIIIRSGC